MWRCIGAVRLALASTGVLWLAGCVQGEPPSSLVSTQNTCVDDRGCEQGACVTSVCSVEETKFGALLLEVVPPPANAGFLGARYYMSVQANKVGLDTEFTILPPVTIGGAIVLSLGDVSCRPSPVEVTFVPVETYLGIDTVRYTAVSRVGTTIINKRHVDTHTYQLPGIPAGTYDVFISDAGLVDNTATPACEVVPDVKRGVTVNVSPGTKRVVYDISEPAGRSLRVIVPSRAWEGWRVDVVHAKSKELLSSRSLLALTDDPTQDFVSTDLRLSTTEPDSNQMLLRLRPPNDRLAPSVSMVLAGLEVFEVGQALVPRIEPFEQLVTYETWIWQSLSGGGPVPGKVHFTALELTNVPAGVAATFDVWANINDQGLVSQSLPPGRYRVDVSPQPGSGFSSASSEVTVWTPTSEQPGSTQGGHVLQVNPAVKLSGTIDVRGQSPPFGTQVRMVGIDAWPSVGGVGIARPGNSLLPANVSDLVTSNTFELESVDCGNCSPDGLPLFYNLEILPTEQSGFPRVLIPGVAVPGSVPIEKLNIELPKVVTGFVVVDEGPASEQGPRGYPGVLVRAYGLLSSTAEPFSLKVPGCWEASSSPACVASAIEIASTYTGIEGAFRLLLPQGFTLNGASQTHDAGAAGF